jgi:outer membrane protein TolC
MTKYVVSLLLVLSVFATSAQDRALTVRDVVTLVLEKDTTVLKSEATLKASLNDYRSLSADKYPQLNLSTSYGVDYTSKMQDSSGGQYENYTTHSVTLGFSLDQLVSTYGTLSVGISDEMTTRLGRDKPPPSIVYWMPPSPPVYAEGEWEDTDAYYAHAPGFSLSFSQPVLFNGKFIDMDLYRASFRKGQIGYQSAAQANLISRNQAIFDAVSLLFDIVILRNEIVKIEQATALKKRGLENLQRNFEQGLVAETEVWEMKVEIGKEREYLLTNVYSLREKEGDLRLTLGLAEDQEIKPAEDLFIPMVRLDEIKSPSELFRDSPTIRQYELSAEEARLNTVIEGANEASELTLSLTLAPRYPYDRPESTFQQSITDFFDEMAGVDIGFTTELKIPLYNGSKWKHKVAADKSIEASRREELAYQKNDLLLSLRMLLLMQQNLKEKIVLLEDNIKLKKKQAEVERALLEVGQTTELDVITLEIEYFEKQNELKKAKMDLYLTLLETLSLMGGNLEEVILQER